MSSWDLTTWNRIYFSCNRSFILMPISAYFSSAEVLKKPRLQPPTSIKHLSSMIMAPREVAECINEGWPMIIPGYHITTQLMICIKTRVKFWGNIRHFYMAYKLKQQWKTFELTVRFLGTNITFINSLRYLFDVFALSSFKTFCHFLIRADH